MNRPRTRVTLIYNEKNRLSVALPWFPLKGRLRLWNCPVKSPEMDCIICLTFSIPSLWKDTESRCFIQFRFVDSLDGPLLVEFRWVKKPTRSSRRDPSGTVMRRK